MKAGKTHGGGGVLNSMQSGSAQPSTFPLPYSGYGPMSAQQQQMIRSTIGRTISDMPNPGVPQPPSQLQSALVNSMSNLRQMPGNPQLGGIGQMPGGPPQMPSPMSMPPNSFPPNVPMPQMQPPQMPGSAQPGVQGPMNQGLGGPQQPGMFRPQLGGLMGGRFSQQ